MPLNEYLPLVGNESIGQRTLHGTWVPPGSRVAAYVGPQSDSTDAYSSSGLLVSTLAAGLARCRAAKGDIVYVLPGHTETVSVTTMLDSLVSGTQIIGCAPFGSGLMPTFTFSGTTTTAVWTVDDANVTISGLRFECTGADSMDTPIIWTGAGGRFVGNFVTLGSDTTHDCDVFLTAGTGADNLQIVGNKFKSVSTAVTTNVVLVSGTAIEGVTIAYNYMRATLSSATGGMIAVTSVASNLDIHHNVMYNFVEDGVGIRLSDVAMTGLIYNNFLGSVDAGGTVANTIKCVSFAGTSQLTRCFENYAVDENAANGVLSPVLPTT